MYEQHRQRGNTHRALLTAALKASEGKSVLLVAGCLTEALNLSKELADIMGHARLPGTSKMLFRYSGTVPDHRGCVQIRLLSDCFVGERYDVIIEDELLNLTYRQIRPWLEHKRMITKPKTVV